MAEDEVMKPEEAQMAIARAVQRKPQVQAVRERLQRLAEDESQGLPVLAAAIRKLMRQD